MPIRYDADDIIAVIVLSKSESIIPRIMRRIATHFLILLADFSFIAEPIRVNAAVI